MNPADVLLIACLALVLIGLVYTLISWRAGYGTGHVLEGLGLAGLSVGIYLSGLMQLAYDLLAALVAWARALVWTPQVQIGIGALVLAVALWLVAGALNRRGVGVRSKEDRQARNEERAAAKADKKQQKAAPATPSAPSTSAGKVTTAAAAPAARTGAKKAGQGAGQGDEFDEVEDILRKRGIS